MNSMANYLAKDLQVNTNTKIISIERQKKWILTDDAGQLYPDFDWVILTVPSHQALNLLPKTFKYFKDIESIKMMPSFALMLGFKRSLLLEFEAAHVVNSDLSWIAVNSHKPGRANHFTLVAHSSNKYAQDHVDDNRLEVMRHLISVLSFVIGFNLNDADYQNIHGWRYANASQQHNKSVFLDNSLKLAACGDWCLGGRIEESYTSAQNLVNALKASF